MKVTLAQINPIVGDIEGNIGLMKAAIATAEQQESDLIIFSECVLTGYPPRDLLGKPWFLKQITKGIAHLLDLSRSYSGLGILFGTPYPEESGDLSNAALLYDTGECVAIIRKTCLPIYDVFDEPRYFTPADDTDVIEEEPLAINFRRAGENGKERIAHARSWSGLGLGQFNGYLTSI